jgi:hypothetical protein
MPGRILTLQRQVRELGRLRAGLTETGTTKEGKEYTRPASSRTWILTSANRDYLDAAAQLWGGDVLEWTPVGNGPKAWRLITATPLIDAILPPGDPLSQHQEMWSRGGCQRRCDGEQEMLSGKACLCRAQFGEDFHEQKVGTVCDIHTRLNVFLPDLPDIGVWRVETKGFWPANHIAGYVDMIKGQVGPQVMVPIRLRIEPRTQVKAGKTSQYIEIVVELRSSATFAQILEAPQVLAIGGPADTRAIEGTSRPAIAAAPNGNVSGAAPAVQESRGTPAQWRQWFAQAKTLDELRSMWTLAGNDGALDAETRAAYEAAGNRLLAPAQPAEDTTTGAADGTTDWAAQIAAAATVAELRGIWEQLAAAKVSDTALKAAWWAKKAELGGTQAAAGPAAEAVTAEVEPDRDEAWTKVLTLAGKQGWNTAKTSQLMRETVGKDPSDADGWAFQQFAQAIQSGQVAA